VISALALATPPSFLTDISMTFNPSLRPALVVISPVLLSEKLYVISPFTLTVTSFHLLTFVALASIGKTFD